VSVLWPGWDRSGRWGRLLFLASLSLFVAGTAFMLTVQLTGDELTYAYSAGNIAAFVRGNQSLSQTIEAVVGFGWFAPGIPILMAPLYLVDPTPNLAVYRLYAALLIFLLWLWALRETERDAGHPYALALLVFPGLDITWHMFAGTSWGDLPAGLVLVLVFARLLRIARLLQGQGDLGFRELFALEALLALGFYLRGNLLVVGVAANIFVAALVLILARGPGLWRRLRNVLLGMAALALAIAPWSIAATRTLGDVVISTSTPAIAFGLSFGRASEICFGPCPEIGPDNIWVRAVTFSRAYGEANGISEVEVQRMMASHATSDLTLPEYVRRVRLNMVHYYSDPSSFVDRRFLPSSILGLSEATISAVGTLAAWWTGLLFFPALAGLAVANLWVARARLDDQVRSLAIKMLTLCVAIQPFFHISTARYWPSLAGIMAIGTAFVILSPRPREGRSDGNPLLSLIQVLYAACALALAVLVLAV